MGGRNAWWGFHFQTPYTFHLWCALLGYKSKMLEYNQENAAKPRRKKKRLCPKHYGAYCIYQLWNQSFQIYPLINGCGLVILNFSTMAMTFSVRGEVPCFWITMLSSCQHHNNRRGWVSPPRIAEMIIAIIAPLRYALITRWKGVISLCLVKLGEKRGPDWGGWWALSCPPESKNLTAEYSVQYLPK